MDVRISYKNFGLYNIDLAYLKHLHDIDGEVRYSEEKAYNRKPFLGVLVMIGSHNYFIPLTSAKPKHAARKLIGDTYFTIYETISADRQRPRDIIKAIPSSDKEVLRVLAVLDIKKMVPVPDGLYHRLDFPQIEDKAYRGLLKKEYRFCLKIRRDILDRAGKLYREQKESGKVYPMFCNFAALEKACDEYPGISPRRH